MNVYQYISKIIKEVIKKTPNKQEWCVYSKTSNKNLGCSDSKKGAVKRLGQVEYFKSINEENLEEISAMSAGNIQGSPISSSFQEEGLSYQEKITKEHPKHKRNFF